MISMGMAARQLGVSKATLSKAIASGKLSATRREDQSWAIDPAELARYVSAHGHRFPGNRVPTGEGDRVATGGNPTVDQLPSAPNGAVDLITERAARELAEQRLQDLKEALAEMRAQRDAWQAQAERLALPAPKASAPERKSLWRWLRSTG
jgi:hypothetical protein